MRLRSLAAWLIAFATVGVAAGLWGGYQIKAEMGRRYEFREISNLEMPRYFFVAVFIEDNPTVAVFANASEHICEMKKDLPTSTISDHLQQVFPGVKVIWDSTQYHYLPKVHASQGVQSRSYGLSRVAEGMRGTLKIEPDREAFECELTLLTDESSNICKYRVTDGDVLPVAYARVDRSDAYYSGLVGVRSGLSVFAMGITILAGVFVALRFRTKKAGGQQGILEE